jgi:hypothetical protein
METLNSLFLHADTWSLLQPVPPHLLPRRTSLYADDMVLFLSLVARDLLLTKCILSLFEKASGLGCNMGKCQMVLIRCEDNQV